jgi:tripeptide aminopeptidase
MDRSIDDLMQLLSIEGPPGGEAAVARFLSQELQAIGVPAEKIAHDHAYQQSEYGGETGNLIVRYDGTRPGPHLMFSAHMDTIPTAVGCRSRLDEANERIVNERNDTALGGDNRTGCAVLLALAHELSRREGAHPPVTLVFFIQEEVGLIGSRGLDVAKLGRPMPDMGFNVDGAAPGNFITAVIGTERFTIDVTGKAAHAGASPGEGISAAVIAAHAIAGLSHDGWHGRIEKEDGRGTANVGILRGGQGSNVVMPTLHILAEARSHDAAFRRKIVATWHEHFTRAARQLTDRHGQSGAIQFHPGPQYQAFALADSEPVAQTALAAAQATGLTGRLTSDDGGMDANWLVAHGIPTVTFGAGQRQIHTTSEWIDLADFRRACRLIVAIVDAVLPNG